MAMDLEQTQDEQESKEQVKREQRYKVEQKINAHLERLTMALEGLADTKDKAEQAAYALLIRKEYTAARALIPSHRALDGSYYGVSYTPFNALYRD